MDELRRLTLHQLRVFRAVAELRGFTRAAESLGLTQAAVSAQMRELSRLLGTPLVEVLGRAVHLTDAGRLLLVHARRAEDLVRSIAQEFAALRGGAGAIRIAASSTVGTYVLPELLAAYTARHPGVDAALHIANSAVVAEGVAHNDFDLGFIGSPPGSPELTAETFLEDEIFFAAAPTHPLARRARLRAKDLVTARLFVREPGSGTRRAMEDHLARLGLAFAHRAQLGAVEAIKQTVMAGLGVSYFSGLTIRRELHEKRLVRLPVAGLAVPRCFYVIRHRQKRETPALAAFLGFLRQRRRCR